MAGPIPPPTPHERVWRRFPPDRRPDGLAPRGCPDPRRQTCRAPGRARTRRSTAGAPGPPRSGASLGLRRGRGPPAERRASSPTGRQGEEGRRGFSQKRSPSVLGGRATLPAGSVAFFLFALFSKKTVAGHLFGAVAQNWDVQIQKFPNIEISKYRNFQI